MSKIKIDATKIEIPLQNLIDTAKMAVGYSKTEIERKLSKIQQAFISTDPNYFVIKSDARQLENSAMCLTKALETMYALQESKCREELVIVREQGYFKLNKS